MNFTRIINVMAMVAVVVGLTGCFDGTKKKDDKELKISIGTATPFGVYYTAGLGIADLVNKYNDDIELTINATPGSVYNVNAVVDGEIDLGIVQSDHQYQAVKGCGLWKDTPQESLRFVCSLHNEMISVMASVDSGITRPNDLRYKTINIGLPLSGTHSNAIDILNSVGIDENIDVTLEEENPEYAVTMLHNGDIDAFFYTVAHPNSIFMEAADDDDTKVAFVPLKDIQGLTEKYPYYKKAVIPVSLYPGIANTADVETIGVGAALMTSEDASDDVIYNITKILFENMSAFKEKHQSFETITQPGMVEGAFAPIHPGAMRFYREVGMAE